MAKRRDNSGTRSFVDGLDEHKIHSGFSVQVISAGMSFAANSCQQYIHAYTRKVLHRT